MDADVAERVAANRARMLAAITGPPVVSVEASAALLRPTVCPRCDYSLAGLPSTGVCPECGRAYDGSIVYLYGSANDNWAGRVPSAARLALQWALVLGGVGAYVLLGRSLGWRQFMSFSGFGLSYWLPGAVIGVLIATRRKASDNGSGVVRLSIGPAGVTQGFRGFGPVPYESAERVKPTRWNTVTQVRVLQVDAEHARLTIAASHWGSLRKTQIDATIRCSPEQTAALRSCMERWRSPSNKP